MATKQTKTLRNLTQTELKQKASDLEQAMFKVRFQKKTGQLADTSLIWKTRKELARTKTLLTQANARK